MPNTLVIVGTQWGDEGKGKIVDYLTSKADYVVRFQGGNNAGHTLVINGQKIKLHLVPCGILRPQARCLIAAGVVANPYVLLDEIEGLCRLGVNVTPQRLLVDREAHLIMDYHPLIDLAREAKRGGGKIGTTGRGIGPAYEDRAARVGVRFAELLCLTELKRRLEPLLAEKERYLSAVLESPHKINFQEMWSNLERAAEKLSPFIANGSLAVHEACLRGERIVFEGAQGCMLDEIFGSVPYVTACSTLAGAVCTGCGIGPARIDCVLGVVKAYSTRVGAGPFPSELKDELGERLRSRGAEFGTTTGRPRRCGWLDVVAVRRAIRLSGVQLLAVTKLDVLSGVSPLRICIGYSLDAKVLPDVPALAHEFDRVEPQYIELPGWDEDISGARRFEELPKAAQNYLLKVEELCECPVGLVSLSAEREATLCRRGAEFLADFI